MKINDHDFRNGLLILIAVYVLLFSISWGFVALIIKLLSYLFQFHFSVKTATGIWLIMLLLRMIFKNSSSSKLSMATLTHVQH